MYQDITRRDHKIYPKPYRQSAILMLFGIRYLLLVKHDHIMPYSRLPKWRYWSEIVMVVFCWVAPFFSGEFSALTDFFLSHLCCQQTNTLGSGTIMQLFLISLRWIAQKSNAHLYLSGYLQCAHNVLNAKH